MSFFDIFTTNKEKAKEANYKIDLFSNLATGTETADMSAIKNYFDSLYQYNSSNFNSFEVTQQLDGLYLSEATNKIKRLNDYRSMSTFPEIANAIDTICYSADIPNEVNSIVSVKVNKNTLEASDVEQITDAAKEYLDLFDFDNNFLEFFRRFVIDGQLCWENIVAKDDLECGIIDINFIPCESYEFCYDLTSRKKIGLMITNTAADMYNIAGYNGMSMLQGGSMNINAYNNLNCYQDLIDNKVLVLPWEQITYIDSGIYNADNKVVYSPLERARRAYNQLMLIEDAILIYRMVRSPEKYVFNVDIGKMGMAKGQQKVAQLMKQFATKKTYDPNTGTVGKTYDPMQMTENFWFVKGADSEGITVNPLSSTHNFGNLEDLEYFLKKLYRSLNIPITRFFEPGTTINNSDTISAEELNFAKFIMSLQKRFAYGLLDGLIVHLKLKGLWDLYKLKRSDIDIIFNPPAEYEQYRKQKILDSKITMLKTALGEESLTNVFSEEIALQLFLDWNLDKIEANKNKRFAEKLLAAKQEYILEKVKATGKLDMASEELGFDKTFAETLLGIDEGSSDSNSDSDSNLDNDSSDEELDFGDDSGDELEF